jgi:hypothetical protein
MTSLTDVYDGGVGVVADPRRRLAGAALFLAGAAMVVGAIPIATTDLVQTVGLSVYEARELAGVLAGLGVPAVFVGILTVVPAGRGTRAGAAIGASLALLGVALFAYAYPYSWVSNDPTMAVVTAVLYSAGTLVTFWCLFVGIATFKTRNDPGGSARVEITDEGVVEIVSAGRSVPSMGGVGLFGTDPDGRVETQTNRGSDDAVVAGEPRGPDTPAPAGDGAGAVGSADTRATAEPAAADADIERAVSDRGRPDRYCGNCSHFEYVRADGEITPYCGLHGELLADMDACDQWDANS